MGGAAVVACPSCGRKNRVPPTARGTPRCGQCGAALPWLVEAEDADFDEVAEQSRLPVLVDFWAAWCGPCRVVGPAVEQLATDLAGRVKVVKVDVDRSPATSSRYGVRSIPTLLLLQAGRVASRQVGAVPAQALRGWVERSLDELRR